jgi:hypothetical protein
LDTVISLRRPDDYKPKNGAVFQVHFEKARGFLGNEAESFEAKFSTGKDGLHEWSVTPVKETSYDLVINLANKGLKQCDIAETLNIDKSNVSRHLKRAHHESKIN